MACRMDSCQSTTATARGGLGGWLRTRRGKLAAASPPARRARPGPMSEPFWEGPPGLWGPLE
eukprot:762141-Hanusia_phi.AAC.1